jgi:hypothetical protein
MSDMIAYYKYRVFQGKRKHDTRIFFIVKTLYVFIQVNIYIYIYIDVLKRYIKNYIRDLRKG